MTGVRRIRRRGRTVWCAVVASTLAFGATFAAGATAAAPGTPADSSRSGAQVGFWTGQNTQQCNNPDPLTCPRDLSAYTPAVWRALQRGHGALYFDLVYTVDYGPGAFRHDALPIIRTANRLGVTVKAWFTTPLDHGTYANEDDAAFEDAAVKAFDRWRRAQHLTIDEVVLDLEVPAGYQAAVDATDPAKLAANRGTVDPPHQCAAVEQYADTIRWAHAHDLVLSGSPMPFLLDDLDNGDMGLADAIDAAPLFPNGYDHLYLQTYRTYSDTGPDYPVQYLTRMRQRFGPAGEISLGDTTMGPPYQSVDEIVADVRTAAALGATGIPIFELASSVQKYGADGIRQILDAGRRPLPQAEVDDRSADTTMTQANLAFFDTLDAAGTAASPSANRYPGGCPIRR